MGKLIKIKSGVFSFYLDTRKNIYFKYETPMRQQYIIANQGMLKLSDKDYTLLVDAIYKRKIKDHDGLFSRLTGVNTYYPTCKKLD